MLKTFLKKHRISFLITVAAGVLRSAAALLIAYLISRMAELVTNHSKDEWAGFALLCVTYYFSYILLYYFSKNLQLHTLRKWRENIKQTILHSILYLDYSDYHERKEGIYLSKLTNDVDVMEENYCREMFQLISNTVTLFVSASVMSSVNLPLTAAILLLLVFYYLASTNFNAKLSKYQLAYVNEMQSETASLQEIVNGASAIAYYEAEDRFYQQQKAHIEQTHRASMRYAVSFTFLSLLNKYIQPFLSTVVLIGGVWIVMNHIGTLSLAGILALMQLVESLTAPVSTIGTSYSKLKSSKKLLLENDSLTILGEKGKAEWTGFPNGMEHGNLSLCNVCFSYDKKSILKNASLVFEKGKKYAIVGSSGLGKSTLAKLLLHLLTPDSGNICIGKKNYQSLNKGAIAGLIAYLGQEPYLFQDSVKNNITFERDGGDYKNAILNSNVDLIFNHLDKGEATLAEETGSNFSGGEKQRIAIARALYTEKPILILDEFSSALDVKNTARIEQNLLTLRDKTVILITHHLSEKDYAAYDGVYALENGSFTDLIQKSG